MFAGTVLRRAQPLSGSHWGILQIGAHGASQGAPLRTAFLRGLTTIAGTGPGVPPPPPPFPLPLRTDRQPVRRLFDLHRRHLATRYERPRGDVGVVELLAPLLALLHRLVVHAVHALQELVLGDLLVLALHLRSELVGQLAVHGLRGLQA